MEYEVHKIPLQNANLILLKAPNGFVMCGYLNLMLSEQLGDNAAIVRQVKTEQDILDAEIVALTSHAKKLGVEVGMTGSQALKLMQ